MFVFPVVELLRETPDDIFFGQAWEIPTEHRKLGSISVS